MNPFSVDATHPGLAEIVASLPLSLAPAHGATPQIAAVSGTVGWARRSCDAVGVGARAVVVAAPADISLDGLDQDTARRVVLDWGFAANPGVLRAAVEATNLREKAVLALAILRVPAGADAESQLLDLFITAGRVFGELCGVRLVHRDHSCLYLAGTLQNGAPLTLTVLTTQAMPSVLEVRLLTEDGGVTAVIPGPGTSAPAHVRVVAPDGERLLPTLWITSRRASWQRAVAIAAGDEVSDDVAELLHISSVASALPEFAAAHSYTNPQ